MSHGIIIEDWLISSTTHFENQIIHIKLLHIAVSSIKISLTYRPTYRCGHALLKLSNKHS